MSIKRPATRKKVKVGFALLAAAVLLGAAVLAAAVFQVHSTGKLSAIDPDDIPMNYADDVPATRAKTTSSPGCDDSLWQHVHQPSRLKILDNCIQASGTIAGVAAMGDGDYHILLRPDLKYLGLMNLKNLLFTDGALVTEAVCMRAPIEQSSESACRGYTHRLAVPPVGAHVVITGPYVTDLPHGWNEIHPVSSIAQR